MPSPRRGLRWFRRSHEAGADDASPHPTNGATGSPPAPPADGPSADGLSPAARAALADAQPFAGVVGALLSHLTLAQAQADQASVELGQFYQQHPWLARLPVPGLHIQDVEVELRVAFVEPPPPPPGASSSPPNEPYTHHRLYLDAAATPATATDLHVLFTPSQLQHVADQHVASIKLRLGYGPKRLVEVDGQTRLLP